MGYYVHKVPGRLRVTAPLVKGRQNLARGAQELLSPINGISSTTINTITGSIVVNYDSKVVSHEEILYMLQQAGYFDLKGLENHQDMLDTAASKAGGVIAKVLLGIFVEKTFENSALSLIAVLL